MAPRKIYLDNADWAYLQEGKTPDTEAVLRRLGENGDAVYLLSAEHWVETAGLSHGRAARVEYLRSFPGACALTCTTDGLLCGEVKRLVEAAEGGAWKAAEVSCVPLAAIEREEIDARVDDGATIRRLTAIVASAHRRSRAIAAARTAKEIRAENKMLGAFVHGDADEFIRQLQHRGHLHGPLHEWLLRRTVPTIGRALRFLGRKGYVSSARPFDPVFSLAVTPWLIGADAPPRVQDDLYKWWRTAKNRRLVPSLACYAALVEAVHQQPDRAYEDSESVDARHAAYAPFADLFTCDKRNEQPLTRILRLLDVPTVVVRTKKHARLRAAVEGLVQ